MKVHMRDGSGQRDYRFVTEDTDRHGNVRLYFRRKGQPKIRLKEKPGTGAFDREYQLALSGSQQPDLRKGKSTVGSMQWLCEQYFNSATFKSLDPKTRQRHRLILNRISMKYGALPYKLIQPKHVTRMRDEKSETPHAANSLLKSLGALFAFATSPEYGHADDNPVAKVKYLPTLNPDGHRTWTDEDVAKYCATYPLGTGERLAIDLILATGVRRSDLIRLGPPMERDGHLMFTEYKGRTKQRKEHRIPISPTLRWSIDAAKIVGQFTYLVGPRSGRPFSDTGFSQWFKDRCERAGIEPGLTPHGIRKWAAVATSERGGTDEELRALFGWTTANQSLTYTRKANKARLESQAATLLAGTERNRNERPTRTTVGQKVGQKTQSND